MTENVRNITGNADIPEGIPSSPESPADLSEPSSSSSAQESNWLESPGEYFDAPSDDKKSDQKGEKGNPSSQNTALSELRNQSNKRELRKLSESEHSENERSEGREEKQLEESKSLHREESSNLHAEERLQTNLMGEQARTETFKNLQGKGFEGLEGHRDTTSLFSKAPCAEPPPPPCESSFASMHQNLNQRFKEAPHSYRIMHPSQFKKEGIPSAPLQKKMEMRPQNLKMQSGQSKIDPYNPKELKKFCYGNFLYETLVGNQKNEEVYAKRREMRKAEHELRHKMRIILFMLLMGNVTGAIRALLSEADRQGRFFQRLITKQLNRVRDAKAKVLLALGRKFPPKASETPDEKTRKDVDKYNQWVSVTTQLMGELEQGSRNLLEVLQESRSNVKKMWESFGALDESEKRATRTLYQSFRE